MRQRLPLVVLTLAFLTIWGCSKYKVGGFVMPSWNTQLSAPIFYRTYSLQEILSKDSVQVSNGDTTYIRGTGSTGVLSLSQTQDINGTDVGNSLKIASIPQSFESEGLSGFAIDSPPQIHYANVDPTLPVGTTTQVPAIAPQTKIVTPDQSFTNFKSATMSGGTLAIKIFNGYPATMKFSGGIDVIDASGNAIVTVSVDSLAPYQSETVNAPLAGVVLPNDPRISFTYSSNGSSTPTAFQSDTLVKFSANLTDLTVSSADAIVPPQPPITLSRGFVLSDGNKVSTASISGGSLDFTVRNGFGISIPVDVVINSLEDQSGPLERSFTLSAAGSQGSSYQESIPLSRYKLNMADAQGNPTDTVKYSIVAQIPGSNGQFVNIANTDSVKASFSLSALQFNSIAGEIHLSNPIEIPTDTQTVNLGDFASMFSGKVHFSDSTKLTLDINMTGGFPSEVHLKLVPSNSSTGSVSSDSLVVEKMLYPGQVNSLEIGADFASMLNKFTTATSQLPDQFIIDGYVVVNPGPPYAIGTVSRTDEIGGTATIHMPFDVGVINSSFVDTTSAPVITDSSTATKLDNVDSGQVVIEVNNGLPVGVSLITQLIDTVTNQVVATFPSDSIVIPAATDFNSDGTVRTPVLSRNEVTLTHDVAVELGRSYMKFDFAVSTPTGQQAVKFTKNNTISMKVYANLGFKIDNNLVGK